VLSRHSIEALIASLAAVTQLVVCMLSVMYLPYNVPNSQADSARNTFRGFLSGHVKVVSSFVVAVSFRYVV